jgi:hypothetical protein
MAGGKFPGLVEFVAWWWGLLTLVSGVYCRLVRAVPPAPRTADRQFPARPAWAMLLLSA